MRLTQKALINLSASSLICCSAGTTFLWAGLAWVGFTTIGVALFAVGLLLFLVTSMLFILRSMLLDQALRKRGIYLRRFLDLFRRIEGARPYQRDIWLQGTVFMFTFLFFVLLGLLGRRIIQNSLPTLLAVPDQKYLGACTIAAICLVFPLGMLLFALASKEITDTLSKDGSEEVSKQ
jgi:hypothetical protein